MIDRDKIDKLASEFVDITYEYFNLSDETLKSIWTKSINECIGEIKSIIGKQNNLIEKVLLTEEEDFFQAGQREDLLKSCTKNLGIYERKLKSLEGWGNNG